MGAISSIINILFEVWFVYYNFIKIKKIKDKKIKFYIGLLINYILSSIIIGFTYKNQVYMLIINSVFNYLLMKILYKNTNIIDLFFSYYLVCLMLFVTIITSFTMGYNVPMMIINRLILLVIALTLYKIIHKVYLIYNKNWNRGNNNKVKSVTIRSYTIIAFNTLLFIANSYLLYYVLKVINK